MPNDKMKKHLVKRRKRRDADSSALVQDYDAAEIFEILNEITGDSGDGANDDILAKVITVNDKNHLQISPFTNQLSPGRLLGNIDATTTLMPALDPADTDFNYM